VTAVKGTAECGGFTTEWWSSEFRPVDRKVLVDSIKSQFERKLGYAVYAPPMPKEWI